MEGKSNQQSAFSNQQSAISIQPFESLHECDEKVEAGPQKSTASRKTVLQWLNADC
jgi:hypothetical protein